MNGADVHDVITKMATGGGYGSTSGTTSTMSGWNWGSAWGEVVEEEDEDNEGVSSSSLFSGRDSVIFLIDCSLGMFSARGKDGEKAIEICIKVSKMSV